MQETDAAHTELSTAPQQLPTNSSPIFFDLNANPATSADRADIASTQLRCTLPSSSLTPVGYTKCAYISIHAKHPKEVKRNPTPHTTRLLDRLSDPSPLSRVDVDVTDAASVNALSSQIFSSYDIIAAHPQSEKSFHLACSSKDIDIICLPLASRMPFYIKSAPVNLAAQHGIFFELPYAPLLSDSRRLFVQNAGQVVKATRGKGVVIGSGAEDAFEIRGVWDVVNVMGVLGMKEGDAINAMSKAGRSVIMHAGMGLTVDALTVATRQDTFKGAISVIKKEV